MKLLPLAGGLALAATLVTVTVRPTEAEPLAPQPPVASDTCSSNAASSMRTS